MPHSNRTDRYFGRDALRLITDVPRCYDCGWATLGAGVGIRRTDAGAAGYAGLATCGRVWLCPVCNSKVMAQRAIEIGAALTWAVVEGLHMLFGSLTVRHNAFTSLSWLLDVERSAWRYVVSSKFWRNSGTTATVAHSHAPACEPGCDRKRDTVDLGTAGRVGYIRAAEITLGRNGWHPHFHPMILWRGEKAAARDFAAEVVALWIEGVELSGGEARGFGAQQLEVVEPGEAFEKIGSYVTKATYSAQEASDKAVKNLSLELVWSQGKTGRGRAEETVSHWSLLADVAQGLYDGIERWGELERAVTGHRMISWSRGLRSFAGLSVELTDEDVAAAELGTADDTVCFLTSDGWASIRARPEVMGLILDVLEARGWAATAELLDAYGVEYFTLEAAPA